MSLILDALRKIEQERKTRRLGNGDLRADVLNYRGTAPPPSARRVLPAVGCVLVVLVAAAGFLLWRNDALRPAAMVQPASAPPLLQPAAQAIPATQPAQISPPAATVRPPAAASQGDNAVVRPSRTPQSGTIRTDVGTSDGEGNLLVSGIAWQEERGLRRAVVNGSLVGEGAEILGAKVVEIRENRVRFSRGGKSFDVIYQGNSGR